MDAPALAPPPARRKSGPILYGFLRGFRNPAPFWQRRGDDNWRDRHASRYGHDDRYRNWHRYAYRPDDWGDRGCISAGPIWYCP